MVSTRRKSYISPPRVRDPPSESDDRGQDGNKSVNRPSKGNLDSPLPSTPKSSSKRKSLAKKKKVNEEAIDEADESPLFVIDKTPGTSYSTTDATGYSEEPVIKDGSTISSLAFSSKKKSEQNNVADMGMKVTMEECNEEEVYEIDMTDVKSAADDQLQLKMSEDDDSQSSSESESSSELKDIESTEEHTITDQISMNQQDDESTDHDVDGDDDEQDREEEESTELFIIDKGPSHSKDDNDSELFILDKMPSEQQESVDDSSSDSESDDEPSQPLTSGFKLSSRIKCPIDLNKVSYINFDPLKKKSHQKELMLEARDKKVDELMKRSVLKPGFEKQQGVEAITGKRQLKRERKKNSTNLDSRRELILNDFSQAERAKTKGAKWYDMAAPEMTSELKNDLSVVHMRRALDPKRFYKNNDMEGLPKYFQMGRVVETAADFYHARVPKKQRKANIVEELLADAEFRKFNKRKYSEIQEKKVHQSRAAYKHMKRLKKKKKK